MEPQSPAAVSPPSAPAAVIIATVADFEWPTDAVGAQQQQLAVLPRGSSTWTGVSASAPMTLSLTDLLAPH